MDEDDARPRLKRHRSPPAIIGHAGWVYSRFALGDRDVEVRLAERGVILTDETARHSPPRGRSPAPRRRPE